MSVADADTPQALTLRLGDGSISLARGAAEDAEVRATVALAGTARAKARLAGAEGRPDLARWVAGLLDPPGLSWQEAADRFWSVLSEMRGAPAALLVVDTEGGEEHRYGAADGRAYELHGAPEALTAVLTGRAPLLDAAFEGKVFVRGSFPELSLLTGAGFTIRYGGEDWDG